MNSYTVKAMSQKLGIPCDTLRYYDKIGLVKPARKPNGYRLYSDADEFELMYIIILKYAGFSLGEIESIFKTSKNVNHSAECIDGSVALIIDKTHELEQKIEHLKSIITFLDFCKSFFSGKDASEPSKVKDLITDIFSQIQNGGYKNEQ